MEDWEERLDGLEEGLRGWRRRFDAAYEAVVKERRLRGWFRRPRPEELRAAVEEARRRAGTEILADLSRLFETLCDRYVKSLPQGRAKIRARVGAAENAFELFWGYVEQCPDRVRGEDAEAGFRRGLAAIAIDDMRAELGLVDGVIGRLIAAAADAGIEWRPIVEEVAGIANPGAGGGGACMRDHLRGFLRAGRPPHVEAPRARAIHGA